MRYTPVKILLLSGLGGCLEFYDFIVFAIFASSISHTFFPDSSALAGLLQTFVIFAVGYLVRPLGGVIMGHFGDRYGRKKIFVLTVFMMGASSLLMAVMPGFAQLGVVAAVLFAVLRVIQGLSLGGEVPGGLTFVAEHFVKRPGLGCGAFFLCINLGIILGNLMHSLLNGFAVAPEYSWRIAFAIGGVLALGSYFIRKTLQETPQFLYLLEDNALQRLPIAGVLRHRWREALAAFCIVSAGAGMVTIVLLYMPSYLHKVLHYSANMSSDLASVGVVVFP